MQNENIIIGSHDIKLIDRKNITITGVKKIYNFDKECFVIESTMGIIKINGNLLELIKLDTNDGILKIKGKISGINYNDENKNINKDSLLKRIFK